MRGGRPADVRWNSLYPFRALATLALVTIGWVFFRAADLHQARQILAQMFGGARGALLFAPWQVGLVLSALVLAVAEEKLEWFERIVKAPAPVYASALALMFFTIEVFGVIDESIPFVYFQF